MIPKKLISEDDIKDLRIGNFLSYNTKSYSNHAVVTGLSQKSGIEYEYFVTPFVSIDRGATGLFAIPLSERWLLKFGFKLDLQAHRLLVQEFYLLSLEIKSENKIQMRVFLHDKHPSFGSLMVNNISSGTQFFYVHELQNLFYALTNKEIQFTD